MTSKIIKSENEYLKAIRRLEDIFDVEASTIKADEAELLGLLIEKYVDEHNPIFTGKVFFNLHTITGSWDSLNKTDNSFHDTTYYIICSYLFLYFCFTQVKDIFNIVFLLT